MPEDHIEVCEVEIRVESSNERTAEGRSLFSFAKENEAVLYNLLYLEVANKLPQDFQVRKIEISEGSVVIVMTLVALRSFLTEYKDIKESLEAFREDLEHLIEAVFLNHSRGDVRVNARLKFKPGIRHLSGSQSTKMKTRVLVTVATLAAIAMALATVFFSENRQSGFVSSEVATNGVRAVEAAIVAACAHCDGKGTCRAEKNQSSCVACKRVLNLKDEIAICSICHGKGYAIPAVEVINARSEVNKRNWTALGMIVGFPIMFLIFTLIAFERFSFRIR